MVGYHIPSLLPIVDTHVGGYEEKLEKIWVARVVGGVGGLSIDVLNYLVKLTPL